MHEDGGDTCHNTDTEVEALLPAALHEIADTHPSELVELQWLIECYLLQPQLTYPEALSPTAGSGAVMDEVGSAVMPMGTLAGTTPTPAEDHGPASQAQPECFDIATPTLQKPKASFTIYTPPGSDTESEKECLRTPRSFSVNTGVEELSFLTPRLRRRPNIHGPALQCSYCRSRTLIVRELRVSSSKVSHDVSSTTHWPGQVLGATRFARIYLGTAQPFLTPEDSRSWGTLYKRPKTWKPVPRRVKCRLTYCICRLVFRNMLHNLIGRQSRDML